MNVGSPEYTSPTKSGLLQNCRFFTVACIYLIQLIYITFELQKVGWIWAIQRKHVANSNASQPHNKTIPKFWS